MMKMRIAIFFTLINMISNAQFTIVESASIQNHGGLVNWADLNNDDFLDLSISNDKHAYDQYLCIYLNNTSDHFILDSDFSLYNGYYPSVMCNFDNNLDGNIDIFLMSKDTWSQWYLNDEYTTFTENYVFPFAKTLNAAFGDYNNDGLVDCIKQKINNPIQILTGQGNNTFLINDNIILPNNGNKPDLIWCNINNDGYLDFLLKSSSYTYSIPTPPRLYINTGNESFYEDMTIGFDSLFQGCLSCVDYNSDGFSDIFSAGQDAGGIPRAYLYKNNGNGNFETIPLSFLDGAYISGFEWGDADNDGDLDMFIRSSNDNSGIYINNDGVFEHDINIINVEDGYFKDIKWGDFDKDNDLDIVVSVPYNQIDSTLIYRNTTTVVNLPPSAPTGLTSEMNGDELILKWNKSTDDSTPQSGLTYNVGVGFDLDTMNILATNSNPINGFRKIVNEGNAMQDTFIILNLRNIPSCSQIYWSVQSIDNSYVGSVFAPIQDTNIHHLQFEEICEGDSLHWFGTYFNSNGYYNSIDTISNTLDSIHTLVLNVKPTSYIDFYEDICLGDTVFWRSNPYTEAGQFYSYNNDPNSCDTVFTLNVNVNPTYYIIDTLNICEGEYIWWSNQHIDSAGTYYANFTTIEGCDSLLELYLNMNPKYHFFQTVSMLSDEVMFWHGLIIETTGVYWDSLTTISGCDSIFELDLTVSPTTDRFVFERNVSHWDDFLDINNDDKIDFFRDKYIYINNISSFDNSYNMTIYTADLQGVFKINIDNDDDFDFLLNHRSYDTGISTISVALNNNDSIYKIDEVFDYWGYIRSLSVEDYNNDGYTDFVVNYFNTNTGLLYCKFIRNNGDLGFSHDVNITNVIGLDGNTSWADYNGDGYIDLLICGRDHNNIYHTKLYKNVNGLEFEEQTNVNFIGVMSSVVWGDTDSDGDLDLLITGAIDSVNTPYTKLYINNGNNNFVPKMVALNLYSSTSKFGDFNNDGLLDIVIVGNNNNDQHTLTYLNTGNNFFSWEQNSISDIKGDVALVDYDNDNDLDLFLDGWWCTYTRMRLYTNTTYHSNTKPNAPNNLNASVIGDSLIVFSWSEGTDNETESAGLTYNIKIGYSSETSELKTCNSNISNGYRKEVKMGNTFSNTFYILRIKDLPTCSDLFWSVQSVDNCFSGSEFAEGQIEWSINPVDTTIEVNNNTLYANENNASYQWINCSNNHAVSGAIYQSFSPEEDGDYCVEITKDGCLGTSSCHNITFVEIYDIFEQSIIISPNPTNDFIYISAEKINKILITNVNGKELKSISVNGNKTKVDLSDFSKGIYFIKVETDYGNSISKVILE